MTIKARILAYIKEKGISREEFYKKTGLSASNFKGAALNSELGGEKVAKILSTYRCLSPNWLLLGEGPMLHSSQDSNNVQSISGDNNIQSGNNSKIDAQLSSSGRLEKLRFQINEMDKLLQEKDLRIKEKDIQIKEKDAQISKLLSILSK